MIYIFFSNIFFLLWYIFLYVEHLGLLCIVYSITYMCWYMFWLLRLHKKLMRMIAEPVVLLTLMRQMQREAGPL